jgi:dTDP-4-amino-4,6-dideoxygalactose transaminase
VPLYCCPVVFKAIEAAGYSPRFIDVDPATCCLSSSDLAAKSAEIDALIAVHMFGNVCDVPRLQAVINGKPIIEDCAQSLGSQLRGTMTGRLGDLAVFSFRSGKYLSVGEGGAVFAQRASIWRRLRDLTAELPPVGRLEEVSHVAKSYVRSKLRSRPLYGLAGYWLWEYYNRSVAYTSKSPLIVGRAYRSDVALSRIRLRVLDEAIARRRANAAFLADALHGLSVRLCDERPDAFYNRLQYPILLPTTAHRQAVAAALYARHIDTSKPYADIASVAATHYGYRGDCPAAEQVANTILVAATHDRLTRRELERIASGIGAALRETPAISRGYPTRDTRSNPAHI